MQGFNRLRLLAAAAGLAVALGATQASATTFDPGRESAFVASSSLNFVPYVDPGAGSLSLLDGDEYNITVVADDTPGALASGFAAHQDFVNNTSFLSVFSAGTLLLDTDFIGEFLSVTIGAVTTLLSLAGDTFAVGAGQTFTINWGATDVVDLGSFSVTVSAVPVPPALLLFGSGLIGMGLLARRRRNRRELTAV